MLCFSHYRELHTAPIPERGFAALVAAEIFLDEAPFGQHKRNSAEGDSAAADIPYLR